MQRFALAISLALVMQQAAAQIPPTDSADGGFTLSVGVELVQIPVLVSGAGNLPQSSFEIFEDNVRQEITLFKHEDTPIHAGVVINIGRLSERRDVIKSATAAFIRESNPGNKAFVVDFDDDSYYRKQHFAEGIAGLVETLIDLDPPGQSIMKKAVLVIVSSEDISGNFGIDSLLKFLKETRDVTIYAIGLPEEKQKSVSKITKEQLKKAAEGTGGEAYFPATVDEVEDICKSIAHELRNQYTLGYSPKNTNNDGSFRSIRVTVTAPEGTAKPVVVRARQGYTARTP